MNNIGLFWYGEFKVGKPANKQQHQQQNCQINFPHRFWFANLSMDVNPKQQITIHSTASTNSLDGAMSWGDNELWAIVPNKTNEPTIPTNRFELNSPLSPEIFRKSFSSSLTAIPFCGFIILRMHALVFTLRLGLPTCRRRTLCLCHYNPFNLIMLLMLTVSTIGSPFAGIVVSTPLNSIRAA